MNKNEDLVGKFIKQAKVETKVTPPASSQGNRLLTGASIGILVGGTYSFLAHTINLIQISAPVLFFRPFGMMGNILYMIILGALAGSTIAWQQKAIPSMIIGAPIIILGLIVYGLVPFNISNLPALDILELSILSLFSFASATFVIPIMLLITGLIRWVIDIQLEKAHLKFWNAQRLSPILLLVGISIVLSYLHKLPNEEVFVLKSANKLIQTGLSAQESSQLPEALKDEHAGNFLSYATSNYKLEINDASMDDISSTYSDLEIYYVDHAVVIYFDNRKDLACLIRPGRTPKCIIDF